jgi:hypothetical protein
MTTWYYEEVIVENLWRWSTIGTSLPDRWMPRATPKIHAGQIFGTWADKTKPRPMCCGNHSAIRDSHHDWHRVRLDGFLRLVGCGGLIFWLTLICAVLSVGWFRLTVASK